MATIRPWREAVDGLHADLRTIVDTRLRALVAYEAHGLLGDAAGPAPADGPGEAIRHEGHIHTLALVDDLSYADLSRLAPLVSSWEKRGLAVPLLLSPGELKRSLDAFPQEFSQIIARHVVVAGDDPFSDLAVAPGDLRRACETQARSHLLHLREGYLQTAGSPRKLAELVTASVVPLRALLVNLARLHGVNARTPDALAQFVSERLGPCAAGLRPLLAAGPADRFKDADAGGFFPAYLQAVERLAALVDEWTR
jgi:hypothetical protein